MILTQCGNIIGLGGDMNETPSEYYDGVADNVYIFDN